jgi:hypothetical protein
LPHAWWRDVCTTAKVIDEAVLIEISYCVDDAGEDVKVLVEATEEEHGHSEGPAEESAGSERNCHFHAGVE